MSRRAMKCRTTSEKNSPSMTSEQAGKRLQPVVSFALPGNRPVPLAEADLRADRLVVTGSWRLLTEINANLQRRYEGQSTLEIALQHPPRLRRLPGVTRFLFEEGRDLAAAPAEPGAQVRIAPQLLVRGRAAIRSRRSPARDGLALLDNRDRVAMETARGRLPAPSRARHRAVPLIGRQPPADGRLRLQLPN